MIDKTSSKSTLNQYKVIIVEHCVIWISTDRHPREKPAPAIARGGIPRGGWIPALRFAPAGMTKGRAPPGMTKGRAPPGMTKDPSFPRTRESMVRPRPATIPLRHSNLPVHGADGFRLSSRMFFNATSVHNPARPAHIGRSDLLTHVFSTRLRCTGATPKRLEDNGRHGPRPDGKRT